jgi:hypothetical protein
MVDSSAEVPAADSDSDFELNPSSDLVDLLQPESGSDFELGALDTSEESEEVEFESIPLRPSDSDVTAADPSLSGINLSRPSDSGINLQGAGAFDLGHHDSIELAPLSDDEIKTFELAEPAKPKPSPASTSPPSVKKGEKDIFDDSDFNLEDSDSGSEVFAIDEEEVDQNAATAMAPAAFAEDEEEDDGFEAAVSSEMATAWSSGESSTAGAAAPAMVISRELIPEWGGVWVSLLGFTTLCLLFASFIAFDLMRNLYDFRDTPVASGLVRGIASIFGG